MTVPSPATVNVGDRSTAALYNAHSDALSYELGQGSDYRPSCHVYNSANQSIPDSTATLVTFNSESWDPFAMHSTSSNTSRVVFVEAGLWQVIFAVRFAASSTGYRRINMRVNAAGSSSGGTSLVIQDAANAGSTIGPTVSRSDLFRFSQGDYVELFATQNSGGALNATASTNYETSISAIWLGA